MELRLRPLCAQDEESALAAQAELREDGFTFLLDFDTGISWEQYVRRWDGYRRGDALAEGYVRSAFLAADVGGELVGRASVRFSLNDFLRHEGGHIGYAIRPAYRRRGYARALLGQALVVARAEGVGDVLVTCNDDNEASARVIQSHAGELEDVVVASDGRLVRRYWIR